MKRRFTFVLLVALCFLLALTGCEDLFNSIGGGSSADSGYYDGRIGDTLTSAFFSFTVNDAWLTDEYEGLEPEDGMIFLVADITAKNEYGDAIPLYSWDFQVQWGEGDDDYGYPIDHFHESMAEDEYEMKKGETVRALYVYEIPYIPRENEYSISFLEWFEDDTYGDVFFIYFDL